LGSHICKCSLARSCYSQTHLLGIAVATSKESCLPVCRHQAEPHAQIQKSIDRIGDGTATSDQSVAVLHHFRLRHFWWKASRVLTSADSKVQVSVAYDNTHKTSVWYIQSLVLSVRRLSLHIHFRDVMIKHVRPIRRVRSRQQ